MPTAVSALLACFLITGLSCAGPSDEFAGIEPVRRDIEVALTTNGRIEAVGGVAVHAAAAGRLRGLYAQRGDTVARNQEILRLGDTGQAAARTQASARLEGAKARLVQLDAGLEPSREAALRAERSTVEAARASAVTDLQRLERLLARNAVARAEVDAKVRALEELTVNLQALDVQLEAPQLAGQRAELEAAVRDAEAALRVADQAVGNLAVRAPAAGVVYSLAVEAGDFLAVGGLVARIGETEQVRARIYVDEPDLGRVRSDSVASITADAYPGREWPCRVERLATEVVELGPRRVGEVLCVTGNPDGLLLPGLAVGARIVTERAEQVLSLPRSAVSRVGDAAYVWTVEDGRAARRDVGLGAAGPVNVEIRKGLDGSELVLLPGDRPITAGQRVFVRLPGAAAND